MSKNNNTQKIVGLGLFTAIVIVLQLMGSFIKFGTFSISLVLVPVVIGAALYGAGAGAWLGFVFGVVVLLSGDAAAFLGVNALGTILTVLVKGTLAGLLSGLVYKALENKNRTLAVAVAAVVCPVVNTGVFLIGCLLFFMETIGGWADAMGFGANVGQYMIVGLVGANFIFELLFNVVFLSTIISLLVQGTTVSGMANLLGLAYEERESAFNVEMHEEMKSALTEVEVNENLLASGHTLKDITLPENTLVMMVCRDGEYFVPQGKTELKLGDKLLVISDRSEELASTYKDMGIDDVMKLG